MIEIHKCSMTFKIQKRFNVTNELCALISRMSVNVKQQQK